MSFAPKKRRLIFHFYLPKEWKTLKCVKLHLACLKRYSFIFNETLFVISVDDLNDEDMIREFEHILLNLGFKGNITFKVQQNTMFYESETVKHELMDKLNELDGITFFGHSKGIGNELSSDIEWKQLEAWITGMYFFSLEYYQEAESKLYGVHAITFGSFRTKWEDFENKNHWIYSGTFFWVNTKRLYDKIKLENLHVRDCSNRFFSELVIGDLLPFSENVDYSNVASSHRESHLIGTYINFYSYCTDYIRMITQDNDYDEYNKFVEGLDYENYN